MEFLAAVCLKLLSFWFTLINVTSSNDWLCVCYSVD